MTLRVAFMGTPDFAVPSLVALHADPRVEVVQVISQPDRARGRGKKLASPPVVEKARALGLDIAQPPSMKAPEAIEAFAALELDPAWWPPTARSCAPLCWRRPGSGASMSTRRSCRDGVVPPPSTARSRRATPSQA